MEWSLQWLLIPQINFITGPAIRNFFFLTICIIAIILKPDSNDLGVVVTKGTLEHPQYLLSNCSDISATTF
jgi:hypothetical protein